MVISKSTAPKTAALGARNTLRGNRPHVPDCPPEVVVATVLIEPREASVGMDMSSHDVGRDSDMTLRS